MLFIIILLLFFFSVISHQYTDGSWVLVSSHVHFIRLSHTFPSIFVFFFSSTIRILWMQAGAEQWNIIQYNIAISIISISIAHRNAHGTKYIQLQLTIGNESNLSIGSIASQSKWWCCRCCCYCYWCCFCRCCTQLTRKMSAPFIRIIYVGIAWPFESIQTPNASSSNYVIQVNYNVYYWISSIVYWDIYHLAQVRFSVCDTSVCFQHCLCISRIYPVYRI